MDLPRRQPAEFCPSPPLGVLGVLSRSLSSVRLGFRFPIRLVLEEVSLDRRMLVLKGLELATKFGSFCVVLGGFGRSSRGFGAETSQCIACFLSLEFRKRASSVEQGKWDAVDVRRGGVAHVHGDSKVFHDGLDTLRRVMQLERLFRDEKLQGWFEVVVLLDRILQRSLMGFLCRIGQSGVDDSQRLDPSSNHASEEIEAFQLVDGQIMLLRTRPKKVSLPTLSQVPVRVIVEVLGVSVFPNVLGKLKADVDDTVDALEAAPGDVGLATGGSTRCCGCCRSAAAARGDAEAGAESDAAT